MTQLIQNLSLFPDLEEPEIFLPDDAMVVVSISGGKDSVATLLEAREKFGPGRVIAHHQIVLEDWPGTIEYCQSVCDGLDVPLYQSQATYHGYVCVQCQHRYLTSQEVPFCLKCKCRDAELVQIVASVLDLVAWRKMWPSLDVRFCTSYFKRDNFNHWARTHRDLLGEHPVVALGERWRESKGRAKLPVLRKRSKLEWMVEWRPVLHYRRVDVFRKMQAYGIEPHYCYKAQGMTDEDMYERNVEGGPRMSCVMCFLKSPEQMSVSYNTQQGRAIIERGIALEKHIGHTIKHGQSLEDMATRKQTVRTSWTEVQA